MKRIALCLIAFFWSLSMAIAADLSSLYDRSALEYWVSVISDPPTRFSTRLSGLHSSARSSITWGAGQSWIFRSTPRARPGNTRSTSMPTQTATSLSFRFSPSSSSMTSAPLMLGCRSRATAWRPYLSTPLFCFMGSRRLAASRRPLRPWEFRKACSKIRKWMSWLSRISSQRVPSYCYMKWDTSYTTIGLPTLTNPYAMNNRQTALPPK